MVSTRAVYARHRVWRGASTIGPSRIGHQETSCTPHYCPTQYTSCRRASPAAAHVCCRRNTRRARARDPHHATIAISERSSQGSNGVRMLVRACPRSTRSRFSFAFTSGLKTSIHGSSGSARRSRSRLRDDHAAPTTAATSGGGSGFAVVRFSGTVKSTHGSTVVSLPARCAASTRSTKPARSRPPCAGGVSGAAGTTFWRAGLTGPAPARTTRCPSANATRSARFPLALRAFFAACSGCDAGAGV